MQNVNIIPRPFAGTSTEYTGNCKIADTAYILEQQRIFDEVPRRSGKSFRKTVTTPSAIRAAPQNTKHTNYPQNF